MNHNLRFLPQIIVRSPLSSIDGDIDDLSFSEAIYLSSTDLYEESVKTKKSSVANNTNLKKVQLSLQKYKSRASYRCTPFGLMAGINTALWGEKNEIKFDTHPHKQFYRKTRLDMNVLCNIVKELEKEEYIEPYLKFYPNSSIYLVGSNLRYIEYSLQNNQRYYHINNVETTPYLKLILTASIKGLTKMQLAELLINDDITKEDAINYINEIISSQILTHHLEPTLTGTEYFESILQQLNVIQSNHPCNQLDKILIILKEIENQLSNIDKSVINSVEVYKNTFNLLKSILPNLKETKLFQTDLFKNTLQQSIHKNIQKQLLNTLNFLNKITPYDLNNNLNEFIKKFILKYQDKEIPLLIALDEENGIGYPLKKNTGINNLVDDIPNYNDNKKNIEKNNPFENCLLKIITNNNKKKVVTVTEKDFTDSINSNTVLPSSIAMMFSVINTSNSKLKLINTSGSSAINLLSRFANTNSDIKNIIKEIADFEQSQMPNKILAEIIHLPENRIGNILSRPTTRAYEIPYLTKSSVDIDHRIQLQDLTIKIKNNIIVLYDTRLKKEVIPRLSNAHNYFKTSLPVYYFLCDIQNQYFTNTRISFNWGKLTSQFDFFPRIEFENTVLCSAKWVLKQKDLEPLRKISYSNEDKQKNFIDLKHRIQLDDQFIYNDGVEELLIDTKNKTSIECFINIIKTKQEVILEEYLFNNNHALITNTNKKPYTNECIALLLNEQKVNISATTTNLKARSKLTLKKTEIKNEWLYYKIYAGPKTCDEILISHINEITSTLLKKKDIDSWFFIRYNDPDSHLRFRLHISDLKKINKIKEYIENHLTPLINQYLISEIQTDNYEKELNRYGVNSMQLIEQLFNYDSEFVMNILSSLNEFNEDALRWQIAIKSVDDLLNDFNFNIKDKHILISQLNTAFFNEHGASKELKIKLDTKYRNLKKQVADVFAWKENSILHTFNDLFEKRSKSNKPIVNSILFLEQKNNLQIPINELIASILHMNLNRLFMGRNRTNEFVVYNLLSRYYKSKLVRLNSQN
ncbi:MAG TPA: lantibiotic dehydratase [Bacteroidia bacterium]|nr:lantibiotic dehydratase [Bacteroidia bacterium]